MAKYIVEFIGTFFLVFTIGIVALDSQIGFFAPVVIGIVLSSLIYAGAHISGAHYNPAVTLCFWLRGKCKTTDVPFYIILQLMAAIAAAYLVLFLKGFPEIYTVEIPVIESLIAEFLFTFALCFVILIVSISKSTEGNNYYGLAIGSVVMVGIFAVSDISGAVFNPAVAAGIILMGLSSITNLWIYLVTSLVAAVVAAGIFSMLNKSEE